MFCIEKYLDINEAKKSLINRFNLENERYKKLYQTDNLDFSNYDLILNSEKLSQEELAEDLYNKYLEFCKNHKND